MKTHNSSFLVHQSLVFHLVYSLPLYSLVPSFLNLDYQFYSVSLSNLWYWTCMGEGVTILFLLHSGSTNEVTETPAITILNRQVGNKLKISAGLVNSFNIYRYEIFSYIINSFTAYHIQLINILCMCMYVSTMSTVFVAQIKIMNSNWLLGVFFYKTIKFSLLSFSDLKIWLKVFWNKMCPKLCFILFIYCSC